MAFIYHVTPSVDSGSQVLLHNPIVAQDDNLGKSSADPCTDAREGVSYWYAMKGGDLYCYLINGRLVRCL